MKQILHIFILIAFLAGIIAPACGFMWGGQYSVIEICTAQGLETRIIANENRPNTPAPNMPNMANDCAFCFATANVVNFLPAAITLEQITFNAEKIRFRQYEDIVLAKYNTNISSRGPPAFI
jgi:hypothetical protein